MFLDEVYIPNERPVTEYIEEAAGSSNAVMIAVIAVLVIVVVVAGVLIIRSILKNKKK